MVQSRVGPCPAARSNQTQTDHMRARGNLPRHIPPPPYPGENTPMSVKPSHTDNFVPTEEEVNWVVRRLRGHRLGFPYRMRAEHL